MESNLDLTIKKPKLNVESVSSAVFGRKDGDTSLKDSINNIHETLSKLTAHVRKSLIRIKGLESAFENIEEKLVINTENTSKVEKKIVLNTEKTIEVEKKIVNIEKVVGTTDKPKLEGSGLRDNYNDSLIETNKILVDIQNQLLLQSQQEKTQEKEEKRRESIAESKKKLKKEESALAKTAKGIGKAVGKVALKIVKPIGGIFDKILEFITLLGAGIAVNAAFEWFKDEENQKKITKFFNILKENWKLLRNIFGTIIAVGAILKVTAAIATIGTVLSFLANPIVLGFLAGAGLLLAGKAAFDFIGDAQAGGKEYNAAHKVLDQRLRDAGMNTAGGDVSDLSEKQRNRSGSGRRGGRSEEQEKIYQSVVSKRKQLRTLQKNRDAALEGVEDDTERQKIKLQYSVQIPGIVSGIEPRAMGGPVTAEQPYLVGEGGPEIFSPNINGSIVNNMRTEKIVQTLSSDMGEGNISMIELPPITNEMAPPEVPVPKGEATEVPNFPSANMADPYRILSPRIYGITV